MNKKKKKIFFKLIILVILFLVTENTFSENITKIKNDIKNQKNEITKIKKEIKNEEDRLTVIRRRETELNNSIFTLNQSQDEINNSITVTEKNIKNVEKEIKNLAQKIQKKNNEIEKKKRIISENLRIINKTQQINPVLIFLSSERFSDFIDSFVFIDRVNSVLADQTGKVIAEKKLLEGYRVKEENNKKVLVSYRKDLDSQREKLKRSENEKHVLLVEVKKSKEEKEKIISEKKKAKKQFEQQLFSLESSLPKIDVKKVIKDATPGQFMRPVKGGWISAEFGTASAYHMRVYKNGKGHNGVDFAVPVGTKVVSAASGTVTATGDSTKVCRGVQYGKWILIRHANGLSTMYAHLSHIAVSEGQKVSKGQYIAKSGTTGYSTGPHLHVSMYATKAVQVKWIPHSFPGRCYGKIMKLPISPWSGYLDPLKYIPRK